MTDTYDDLRRQYETWREKPTSEGYDAALIRDLWREIERLRAENEKPGALFLTKLLVEKEHEIERLRANYGALLETSYKQCVEIARLRLMLNAIRDLDKFQKSRMWDMATEALNPSLEGQTANESAEK